MIPKPLRAYLILQATVSDGLNSQPTMSFRRSILSLVLAIFCLLVCASLPTAAKAEHGPVTLPLTFEQNNGQADPEYSYILHRDDTDAMFLRDGIDFLLPAESGNRHKIHLQLIGGDATPTGLGLLQGQSNYLRGADSSRWIRSVPNFSIVKYPLIYPGISLNFYGNGHDLEHDFTIEPGADPTNIAFQFDTPQKPTLTPQGDLKIHTPGNILTLQQPVAYQDLASGRKYVDAGFQLADDGTVRFRLANYDHGAPLVIDPVLVFSTYFSTATTTAVTTDTSGNIYITGNTSYTSFPVLNAVDPSMIGSQDAFVTKLDPTGTHLIYSTYLGSSSNTDSATAIAVDSNGNAIVVGNTINSNFPHVGAVPVGACGFNSNCAFVASLTANGSQLNYSGLFGAYATMTSNSLALDAAGNAYFTGTTDSSNFLVTTGTLSSTVPNYPYSSLFVMKVDPTGKVVYSTIIPGNAPQQFGGSNNSFTPAGIVVDASGQATVDGIAGPGLPTSAGVVQPTMPNTQILNAGFVLQLNPTASALNFASYLPGTYQAQALAMDPKGDLYVLGKSGETKLPTTATSYQQASDYGVVMELSPGATSVLAATYFNPFDPNYPAAISLDSKNNVFIAGMASSGFPFVNPFVAMYGSTWFTFDMGIAEFKADLSSLLFSSYLSSTDAVFPGSTFAGLAVDNSDHLVVTGQTMAYDFPTTGGSYEPLLSPNQNPLFSTTNSSFVAKLDLVTPAPAACLDTYSFDFGTIAAPASKSINLTNCGNAPLHLSSVVSSDPFFVPSQSCGIIAAGASCPVTITASPLRSGDVRTTVLFNDDASVPQQKVIVTAKGYVPSIEPVQNPVLVGHQVVGATGAGATLSFYGNATLRITSAYAIGSSFSVTNFGAVTLAGMYFWYVNVAFSPQAVGPLSGTLLVASNDPVNPILAIPIQGVGDSAYQAPSIDYLSPATTLINSGPVKIVIYGNNFYPSSLVYEGGTPLPTTYGSSTQLAVTLPASTLTSIGQIPITVVNPSPGGTSAPVSFSPYQTLLLNPSALAYSSATGLLYAAIPSYATNYPNTIIPVTPSTGAVGVPIPVGKNPYLLSVSSDGQYLYVALATDQALQRINLKTNTVERTFPYDPSMVCASCGNIPAYSDLQAVPGSPLEAVLGQGGKVSLFNDSGLVNTLPFPTSSLAFAGNPVVMYGLTDDLFTAANLTNTGLQPSSTPAFGGGPLNHLGSKVLSDGSLLYTITGQVWNPVTKSQVGSIPLTMGNSTGAIALDASNSSFYAIGQQINVNGLLPAAITAFSTKSLNLTGELTIPAITWPDIESLVRWGSDGFAFIASGANQTDQELYLVRSGIVTPPASNPAPVLSNVFHYSTQNPPGIARVSSSDLPLILIGTHFAPGAVVYWNGTALPTFFNSGAELTATASASLTQSPGTAQITVVNPLPGGGTSNALPFTLLDAPYPAATLSSSSLSFSNVGVGNSSSPQYVSISNYGFSPLSITSITASGDFSASSTCTTNLVGLNIYGYCEIAVVFKPTATGQRTGTVTITDDALDSPQVILLSGTGVPAPPVAISLPMPSALMAGATDTITVTLTTNATYSGKVNLSCALTSSPTGAQSLPACSLNPASMTLPSSSSGSATVTVTTNAGSVSSLSRPDKRTLFGLGSGGAVLACLLMLGVPVRRRRTIFMLVLLCVGLVAGTVGCGGAGAANVTPPPVTITPRTAAGTYTFTVTATDSTNAIITASNTFNVLVQ